MKRKYRVLFISILFVCIGNVSIAQSTGSNSDSFPSGTQPTNIAPGFGDYSHIDVDSTYTLQLVAMDTLDKAIAYAKKHNIEPRTAGVARTHTNGYLWYILAAGVYSTRAEALEAKKQLEARGVPSPWIRTLGAIERLSVEANVLDM